MPVKNWKPEPVIKKALDLEEVRMGRACAVVVRNVKTLLNKGGGKDHVPSKPGEPPHKQSSRLYKSIYFKVIRQKNEVIGAVYSDDPKAARLEFGFVGKDRLGRVYDQAARPFMRPGFERSKQDVKRILGNG